jgi:hypothetical protein
MKYDVDHWPPIDEKLVEFPLMMADITPEIQNLLYGSSDHLGRFNSIYRIPSLTDKWILDSMTESISEECIDSLYEKLNEINLDITLENSIVINNENLLEKYPNAISFPYILFEVFHNFSKNEVLGLPSIFPYIPYDNSYIEKLKQYKKPNKFLCLNGSAKDFRMILLNELHRKGYDNNGMVTFLMPDNESQEQLEEFFYAGKTTDNPYPWDGYIEYPYDYNKDYFSKVPFLIDTILGPTDEHPDNWAPNPKYWENDFFRNNRSVPKSFFEDCYFQIIPETVFFSSNGKYWHRNDCVSEKTYKGLLFNPFLSISSPHTIKLVKSYGFQTFDSVIDESYDSIEDDNERFWKVMTEVDKLMNMSDNDLHELFVESLPIILHNQTLIYETTPESLVNKFIEDIVEIK